MANKKVSWLNVKDVHFPGLEKPCSILTYCPYKQLVEEFPLHGDSKLSCLVKNGSIMQFGHDCPVHYHAELVSEELATWQK